MGNRKQHAQTACQAASYRFWLDIHTYKQIVLDIIASHCCTYIISLTVDRP